MFGHRLSTHFDITCVDFVHSSNSPFLYSSYGRYIILLLCGVVCKLDIQPSLWTTHRLDMLRTAWHFPIICAKLLYSIAFYYMYLHPWIQHPSHSLHCWMSTRLSILSPQVSITLFDSRSIIISSQTHSIQLPTFFIPSNHVLTSPDSPSFHSAFIYTHHKGKKHQNSHSFTQKKEPVIL